MFGPKSSAAHIEAARRANLSSVLLQMTSVFLDIDAVDDLIQLANSSDGAASIGVARELLASVQLGGLRAPDDS
jgi:2-phospho-L-lactate guanylyltransferase (CobY/MobA/RfbA family)